MDYLFCREPFDRRLGFSDVTIDGLSWPLFAHNVLFQALVPPPLDDKTRPW